MLTDMVPSLWHEPLNLKDLIDTDMVRIQVKLEVQSERDGFCLGDEGELKIRLRSVRAMKNVRSLF